MQHRQAINPAIAVDRSLEVVAAAGLMKQAWWNPA